MKVLNKKQVKKLLANTKHNFDVKNITILEKEKKLYLTTKAVVTLNTTNLQIRSTGLFLGTLEGKQLKISQAAEYLFTL